MRSMKSIVATGLVVLLLVSGFVTYRWVGSQRRQAVQPSVAAVAAVPTASADADAKAASADAGKDSDAEREQSLDTFLAAHPNLKNKRAQPIAFLREKLAAGGGESSREATSGPAQEQYDNRAYPEQYITPDVRSQADTASEAVAARYAQRVSEWQLVGPRTGTVPGEVTYTGRTTTTAGRVTALAVAPNCSSGRCGLYMGAAGGGVWYTNDALYPTPIWKPITEGIDSTAIGSLYIDGDQQSDTWTIYAGTGEPNGSSDSEAGVGLYRMKNTDSGWTLVPGSVAVARDRSIAGIAIDPKNKQHLWIGTAVARHGSSAVNGGRFTPPNAPTVGLYESLDGGQTFTLAFSVPADKVIPNSANGGDFFRGGVSKLQLDPQGRLYFSVFGYGLYRAGSAGYEQVFASAGEGAVANSAGSRTEFALAPMGQKLRIYLGDTNGADPAEFYRVDDANVAAAQLTDGSANAGWIKLSNEKKGTPGFASYDYCSTQCSYDMPVASPPGSPDVVYIGGQMQYAELGVQSNGRAIQRSADAGVDFTDMTNDARTPEPLGMHPDQHAIAFAPFDPNIAFFGSDGGVVRISGEFVNHSADCAGRNLADAAEVTDCKAWLSAIPTQITSLNEQLSTLQFQSVSVSTVDSSDLMGGTQDNGTWAFDPNYDGWFETVGGDGGQSGFNPVNQNIRVHSYYSAQHDVNFQGTNTFGWNWISDPLIDSKEAASFYVPIITDPVVGGTMFDGLQHVWRTQDNGGSQEFLEQYCNEFTGDYTNRPAPCGDWVPLGGPAGSNKPGDLVGSAYGSDKSGSYVVAITRASSDNNTMWVATRRGRLFVSSNADARDPLAVTFNRVDTASQPTRFISGITVDPQNPNHAWVSFSGYNAYTPTTAGHVFEVTYNPTSGSATWKDLSYDLGDQPVTSIARFNATGELFVATDFGVASLLPGASSWTLAARNLPPVAVYGLTMSPDTPDLYAATHGRGIWRLSLRK